MADTRRYWITTHDPHGPDDHWYVYRKEAGKAKGETLKVGDVVLFYETGNKGPDGKEGRRALICCATVTGPLGDRNPPKGEWIYQVPCSLPEMARKEVGATRMWKAAGEAGKPLIHTWRGLKEITRAQYEALHGEMRSG